MGARWDGAVVSDTRWVTYRWEGDVMRPFGVGMAKRADEQYVVGELYRLAEPNDRTQQAEGFYFANLKEMWGSLPEKYNEDWFAESPDALRHYALIKTGFANTEMFPCETVQEAKRWAAFLGPMSHHAIIKRDGTTVYRFTAKSQSRKAMPGRATFAESTNKVLDFVADLIGLPADADQRKPQ